MEICVRGCLPALWKRTDSPTTRRSIIEMHTFLATLVRQFEFALPDGAPRIRRWRPGFLIPVVEGEEHEGPQLPLTVTPLNGR